MKKILRLILCLLLFATTGRGQVPTNGLLAWYPFNGNANDESGNGRNGTVTGATLTTDRWGNSNKAYNFPGSMNYIDIPFISGITNQFTFSGWFLINTDPSDPSWLALFLSNCYCYDFGVMYSLQTKLFRFYNGTCEGQGNVSYTLPLQQWFHFAFTYDGQTVKIYINGSLQGTISHTWPLKVNHAFTFGRTTTETSPYSAYFWKGKMDDIRLYNRNLTATEVQQLYQENIVNQDTIQFSGITWDVKNGGPLGPDSNFWSNSNQSVWVDDLGQLHLKIRKEGNIWYCSEIVSQQSFGYGEYRFYIANNVDLLDKNTVVGLFTYETDIREIDIEFARWCIQNNPAGNYTVQPSNSSSHHEFELNPQGDYSTHKFFWNPENIFFQSYHGHYPILPSGWGYEIDHFTYAGPNNPPPGNERLILNFWLKNHLAPSNGLESEVIIKSVLIPGGPCPETPTVSHVGKTYNTIQIGSQCWMKENLNIGTRINGSSHQTNNGVIEKYCYNDLESNCDIYGGLYEWDEMMQYVTSEGVQGICPSGWHVPTDDDWCTMTQYVDNTVNCNITGWSGINAGSKLKEAGTTHWIGSNTTTNSSGFTAIPGGTRSYDYLFYYMNSNAYLWSSTEFSPTSAWYRGLYWSNTNISRAPSYSKFDGFNVRCLKDNCTSYLPVSVSINTSANPILSGTSATFTAIPVNGGTPAYLWKVNGIVVGTNANTYTYLPTNNDVISCTITSNLTCVTNNPSVSNSISMVVYSPGGGCAGVPTVNYGGKIYNTIEVGTQCWLRENLDIGVKILGTQGQSNNQIIEKYCYADNDSLCNIYGGLYQWNEMMQYITTEGAQGICPTGWHIPSDGEWTTLSDFLGGDGVAGSKLKESGFLHWEYLNIGATNISGFTGLPGGCLYVTNGNGVFMGLSWYADFWSSTEFVYPPNYAWHRSLYCEENGFFRGGSYGPYKANGFSVRCIKNEYIPIPLIKPVQNITIPNTQTNCYNATQTVNVAGNGTTFTVQSGGSATMIAGQNIVYLPTTTVQTGGYMHGYIAPSGPWCPTPSMPAVAMAVDEIPRSYDHSSFKIYPNPTTGNFILDLVGEKQPQKVTVDIFGIWGEKVLTKTLYGEERHEFSLSDRPVGIYFIRLISGDKAETVKIIKQ